MEFFEVINARRSVRRYTAKIVPDEIIHRALEAALKAPNSSNLQPWEFYWVKSEKNKQTLIDACLFQGTARSASHLIVAVARIDTWKRNRNILLEQMASEKPLDKFVLNYYKKIIPFVYTHDPLGMMSAARWLAVNAIGLFRPIFRAPIFRKDLLEVVTKTTALACENFMLAIFAQGYGCCPMEGFDECRVKKLLRLGRKTRVVMVISVGEIDPKGITGPQYRVSPELVIHEI